MYYLLKDGARLRRAVVAQVSPSIRDDVNDFISDACGILRDYGRGRTAMSAIVAVVVGLASLLLGLPLVFTIIVVNFIGGYIPYIGAFLGGGLAVIVALGDGGLGVAAVMLVVVLASNLLLENFVEPKVMGRTLDIHPLVVLVVTALGGFLAGIVGLILAVPFTVIAGNADRPTPIAWGLQRRRRPCPAGRAEACSTDMAEGEEQRSCRDRGGAAARSRHPGHGWRDCCCGGSGSVSSRSSSSTAASPLPGRRSSPSSRS